MKPDEKNLRDWLVEACQLLGVECHPDFIVSGARFPVFLPHFGSAQGMVIGSIGRSRVNVQPLYMSLVNAEVYSGNALLELKDALNDWGWFGPQELRPRWYTGAYHGERSLGGSK